MLVKLFVTLVHPTFQYNNAVWEPLFILDQKKIEKVQHRATRLLPMLKDKTYSERLSLLQLLPSLAHRHHRVDLVYNT